jgi:hypothetical protein
MVYLEKKHPERPGAFSLVYASGVTAGFLPPFPAVRVASNEISEAGLGRMKKNGFAHEFYSSWTWVRCARAYKAEKRGLCERCLKKGLIVPGDEVHHKIRLTPDNINDPAVALNWDNLELLCKRCHLEEHNAPRWRADELGHVEL